MNVLIVDDEINICTLIRQLIDWDRLGLNFVGRASNGKEALEMIPQVLPDIVITDIRMPGMDGLALVKESNLLYGSKVSFVIISGHKQFDYAYEAIKYGVVDFLLKPVNKEELNQVLWRFSESRRKKDTTQNHLAEDRDRIVRKQFLINLLHNPNEVSLLTMDEINKEYSYDFSSGTFLPAIIKFDNYDKLDGLGDELRSKIESQFYQRFASLCYDLFFYPSGDKIFLILNYDHAKNKDIHLKLESFLDKILEATRPFHFVKVTLGLGLSADFSRLQDNFRYAENAVASRSMLGANRVIDFSNYHDIKISSQVYRNVEESEKAQELLDKSLVNKLCKEYFEHVKTITQKSPYQVAPLVLREVQMMIMGAVKYHIPEQTTFYAQAISEYSFDHCTSPEDILAHMEYLILKTYDEIISSRESEDSKIIKTIKEYIADNIGRQVSLEEVSKLVYLSPAYLGIFFKKETGELFSQYCTGVKMAKAKEYLRNFDYSIKEIADKLGYKDIRNFSKLFRTTVGVKPTEYRKLYHMD